MKNFKLLLATSAMLSATLVSGANADGSPTLKANQAQLEMFATFVSPTTLTQTQYLSFGTIAVDANIAGKKVVVGTGDALATNSTYNESTTADMLIDYKINNDGIEIGDVRSGKMEITGAFGHGSIMPSGFTTPLDADAAANNNLFSVTFTDVNLTPGGTGSNIESCGTVNHFVYTLENDGEGTVTASVGATLTAAAGLANMTAGTLVCKGTTTATVIIDQDKVEDLLN